MNRSQNDQQGYVLMVVIALLALVVTALASLSSISLRQALAASDAQTRLQIRLGALSLEQAVLPRVGHYYDDLQKQWEKQGSEGADSVTLGAPVRSVVVFGGVTYDLRFADEDAKLNLNRLYHVGQVQRVNESLQSVLPPPALSAVRVIPALPSATWKAFEARDDDARPGRDAGEESLDDLDKQITASRVVPNAMASWGQVFDLPTLAQRFDSDAALPNVTQQISLWSGGAVNLRRAPDAVILAAARCVLSQSDADQFLDRYHENPTIGVEILVNGQTESKTERERLLKLLGQSSSSFSLWVDAKAEGQPRQRWFAVMLQDEEGTSQIERWAF